MSPYLPGIIAGSVLVAGAIAGFLRLLARELRDADRRWGQQ